MERQARWVFVNPFQHAFPRQAAGQGDEVEPEGLWIEREDHAAAEQEGANRESQQVGEHRPPTGDDTEPQQLRCRQLKRRLFACHRSDGARRRQPAGAPSAPQQKQVPD